METRKRGSPKGNKRAYVVVGNPGAGKSTLLNGLMGEVNFKSGISVGTGLTTRLLIKESPDGTRFIDTPGLADIKIKEEAAEEINQAFFQEEGPFTLIFVMTLEGGRFRDGDIATIRLTLEATKVIPDRFCIIVNNISREMMKKMNAGLYDELFVKLNLSLPVPTLFIYLQARDDNIFDECDQMFPMDENFKSFIGGLPIVAINHSVKIDTSKWEPMRDSSTANFQKFAKIMKDDIRRLAEEITNRLAPEKKTKEEKFEKGPLFQSCQIRFGGSGGEYMNGFRQKRPDRITHISATIDTELRSLCFIAQNDQVITGNPTAGRLQGAFELPTKIKSVTAWTYDYWSHLCVNGFKLEAVPGTGKDVKIGFSQGDVQKWELESAYLIGFEGRYGERIDQI
jgi:energy-coupling factor transporter ATP-binding protein EcfA2